MPRSRRRHHSRSRSRSRSHSHDRDREPKRRKIESFDSPHQRRSVSSEPEANEIIKNEHKESAFTDSNPVISETTEKSTTDIEDNDHPSDEPDSNKPAGSEDEAEEAGDCSALANASTIELDSSSAEEDTSKPKPLQMTGSISAMKCPDLAITPKKAMSPKQLQKRLESEKKRQERQKEKEDREKKRQEERDEKLKARAKQRQEKEDQKQKEKEVKEARDKEKEQKRKEREEKEEQRRKEREQEKLKKQQEIEDKNREKQKLEEQKQKAAAAFVNFFVPKKAESADDKKRDSPGCIFMPFEIKSDMRLAPVTRKILSATDKDDLLKSTENQGTTPLYLQELKSGKTIGKCGKTWIYDDGSDDIAIIEDLGECIVEHKSKMKAKFLKFHENQRPPYYGTWRKQSKLVTPRKPIGLDKDAFNYDVDSDDEWEDEEDGESVGSHEEEKENESENDNDYEVDNDVFVPHAYLSGDEGVDEEDEVVTPEAHKAMLKLLKNQFEEERMSKTQKIKPRVIGCVWYDIDKKVDDAIDRYLQPLAIICANTITIKKRSDPMFQIKKEKKGLDPEFIPDFLKLIHGNTHKRMFIIKEYLEYLSKKGVGINTTKVGMGKQLKQFAQWTKCQEEGPMHNKQCWIVDENVMREHNVELQLPNKWDYVIK